MRSLMQRKSLKGAAIFSGQQKCKSRECGLCLNRMHDTIHFALAVTAVPIYAASAAHGPSFLYIASLSRGKTCAQALLGGAKAVCYGTCFWASINHSELSGQPPPPPRAPCVVYDRCLDLFHTMISVNCDGVCLETSW